MRTAASINEHQHLSPNSSYTRTHRVWAIFNNIFFPKSSEILRKPYKMKWIEQPTNHTNNIITFIVRCCFVYVDILFFCFVFGGVSSQNECGFYLFFSFRFSRVRSRWHCIKSFTICFITEAISRSRYFFFAHFHSENCTDLLEKHRWVLYTFVHLCGCCVIFFVCLSPPLVWTSFIQYHTAILICHVISFSFQPKN